MRKNDEVVLFCQHLQLIFVPLCEGGQVAQQLQELGLHFLELSRLIILACLALSSSFRPIGAMRCFSGRIPFHGVEIVGHEQPGLCRRSWPIKTAQRSKGLE